MTLEEMEALRDKLATEKDQIALQLDHARHNAAVDGVYGDKDWYCKAQHALRCKRREYQDIVRQIADFKKEKRRTFNDRLERCFVEVCRRRLDGELFRSLWHEALDETEGGDKGH